MWGDGAAPARPQARDKFGHKVGGHFLPLVRPQAWPLPCPRQMTTPALATLRQCVQKPVRAGVPPPPSGKNCQQARASAFFWRQQPGAPGGLRPGQPSICPPQRKTHFRILNKRLYRDKKEGSRTPSTGLHPLDARIRCPQRSPSTFYRKKSTLLSIGCNKKASVFYGGVYD